MLTLEADQICHMQGESEIIVFASCSDLFPRRSSSLTVIVYRYPLLSRKGRYLDLVSPLAQSGQTPGPKKAIANNGEEKLELAPQTRFVRLEPAVFLAQTSLRLLDSIQYSLRNTL